jgi:hypothetical protein
MRMMTGLERFEVWAPEQAPWSLWAKPIVFAELPESLVPAGKDAELGAYRTPRPLPVPAVAGLDGSTGDSALVIDLPGPESVAVGLAAAAVGYRPVPLFAGCQGSSEIVPQSQLREAIREGTAPLLGMGLPLGAPPAFLLDSHRMPLGNPPPRSFDNRWQVFPQDFPSASKLLHHGIRKVFVLKRSSSKPENDLLHILVRWQKAGIAIAAKSPGSGVETSLASLPTPPGFHFPWHRAITLAGLRQSSTGGFGGVVPEPSKG